MTDVLIHNGTKISGYCVRHSDIIKNKKDKDKIAHLTDIVNRSNKNNFSALCEYLVINLRDRYSGDQTINGDKKLSFFNHNGSLRNSNVVDITINRVLKELKDIHPHFTEEDAKTLIALCTHRHTSFSRIESYPKTLKCILKQLKINPNEKSLYFSITRFLNQLYYCVYYKVLNWYLYE